MIDDEHDDPRNDFRLDVNFCRPDRDQTTGYGIMYVFRFRMRVAHEVLAAWRTLAVTPQRTNTDPPRPRGRALGI